MANILMWHQGRGVQPLCLPDCGGGPRFTCPEATKVAAEYHRSYFTLTNVLNPNYDNAFHGRETWQQRLLSEVQANDTLWLVMMPPKHTLYDVAAYGETTLADGSSLASLAGLEADLVTATFSQANENQLCEPTNVKVQASLTFPDGADPEEVFVQKKVELTSQPKQWVGVGLKIKAMPTGETDLANIRAKIGVVAHILGYDTQTHM